MSDIQRWDVDMHGSMFESDDGPLVFHADHVAAVAAARDEERAFDREHDHECAYELGVKAARDAVAAVVDGRGGYHPATAIAAIDGVQP